MSGTELAGSGNRARRALRSVWPGGVSDLVLAVPPLVVFALLVFFDADQGALAPTVWYLGALIVLWLAVILVFDVRFGLDLREWRTAALGLFVLFALWSFLSIVWAQVDGDAWDGANLTLFYVTIYALFSRWPTNGRVAGTLASAYALVVAAVGLITLERGLHGGHPTSMFLDWQLTMPIGYHNGNAALFLMALFPALYLASRRELPPLARGLLLAGASVLVQVAVLAQSRGSMLALPVALALFFVLVSGRGRAIVTAASVLALSAINLPRLLDVFRAGQNGEGDFAQSLVSARNGMILPVVLLLVGGSLVALVDSRLSLSQLLARRLDRAVVAATGLVTVLAVVLALSFANAPHRIGDAWHNFKSGTGGGSSSSHFTSLGGTNRYDFWRVSMSEFRENPLTGIGADNFAVDYVRERRSDEEPKYPHSLEIRTLLQTGLVGSVLLVSFLACALVATRNRRLGPFRRGLGGALVAGFAYWLIHGSVDWLWELPALGFGAFAFLGLAAALARSEVSEPVASSGHRRAVGVIVAALALVASASYLAPWLSHRDVEVAAGTWRADPSRAYRLLDQARSVDPLSANPDLVAGAIAARRHDYVRMRDAYARALERNPYSWYAHLELAIAESLTGSRSEAIAQLEWAHELNPRESVISSTLARIRSGKRVRPEAINRVFLRRARQFEVGAH